MKRFADPWLYVCGAIGAVAFDLTGVLCGGSPWPMAVVAGTCLLVALVLHVYWEAH